MVDAPNAGMQQVFDRVRQRIRSRSWVDYGSREPSTQFWQQPQGLPDSLRQNLAVCNKLERSVGGINPRNPGLHNRAIQAVKKLMRRSLTWYTRPLNEFHDALLRTLHDVIRMLQDLEDRSRSTMKRLDDLQAKSPATDKKSAGRSASHDDIVALSQEVEELSKRLEATEQQVSRLADMLSANSEDAAGLGLGSEPSLWGKDIPQAIGATEAGIHPPAENDRATRDPVAEVNHQRDTGRKS